MCLPKMGKTDSALLDTNDPSDHKEIKGIQ